MHRTALRTPVACNKASNAWDGDAWRRHRDPHIQPDCKSLCGSQRHCIGRTLPHIYISTHPPWRHGIRPWAAHTFKTSKMPTSLCRWEANGDDETPHGAATRGVLDPIPRLAAVPYPIIYALFDARVGQQRRAAWQRQTPPKVGPDGPGGPNRHVCGRVES